MIAIIEAFRHSAMTAGLDLPSDLIADGTIHRFTVPGDKNGSRNGWYVLHANIPAAGAFGCWRRGIWGKWSASQQKHMHPAELKAYIAKMDAIKREREADRKRLHAECRAWCAKIWVKARPATSEHPYLKRKGVNAYGLKILGGSLLVPVQDLAGAIHGLQFIHPHKNAKIGKDKIFKTGTDKTGHFFKIGMSKDNTLIICEGYATGASIFQATGHGVVVAFDKGNLKPVAQVFRARYPGLKIIICADNDHWTKGNPGLTHATDAARAVNGLLAIPAFKGWSNG